MDLSKSSDAVGQTRSADVECVQEAVQRADVYGQFSSAWSRRFWDRFRARNDSLTESTFACVRVEDHLPANIAFVTNQPLCVSKWKYMCAHYISTPDFLYFGPSTLYIQTPNKVTTFRSRTLIISRVFSPVTVLRSTIRARSLKLAV